MRNASVRRKVGNTLSKMGHGPIERGGNGTGPTKAEAIILNAFPSASWNLAVKTGGGIGYPSNYKIDVAFPVIRLAVECDGNSHNALARQFQDRKKEAKLRELGWLVLRLSNKRIFTDTVVIQELRSIISKLEDTQVTSLPAER